MNFDFTIRRWHKRIIRDAEKTLGRPLRDYEKTFITSRGGCVALEMIHDTVKTADREELEEYLGSERQPDSAGGGTKTLEVSPAARPAKSLRFAITLNLLLPGAGQLYTGQMALGATYVAGFGALFLTMVALFLRAYAKYVELSTAGGILEADHLEQLAQVFPYKLLLGMFLAAVGIYLAALLSLRLPSRSNSPQPE